MGTSSLQRRGDITSAGVFEDEAILPADHSVVCTWGRRLLGSCLAHGGGNSGRGEAWRRQGRRSEGWWWNRTGETRRFAGRKSDGLRRYRGSLQRHRGGDRHCSWGSVGARRIACRCRIAARAGSRKAGQKSGVIAAMLSRDHILGKLGLVTCSGKFALRSGQGA